MPISPETTFLRKLFAKNPRETIPGVVPTDSFQKRMHVLLQNMQLNLLGENENRLLPQPLNVAQLHTEGEVEFLTQTIQSIHLATELITEMALSSQNDRRIRPTVYAHPPKDSMLAKLNLLADTPKTAKSIF